MNRSLEGRVSRLEDAAGVRDEPHHVIRIITKSPDTDAAAIERYRAEHPEVPDYAMFIVREIVSPQHGEGWP